MSLVEIVQKVSLGSDRHLSTKMSAVFFLLLFFLLLPLLDSYGFKQTFEEGIGFPPDKKLLSDDFAGLVPSPWVCTMAEW